MEFKPQCLVSNQPSSKTINKGKPIIMGHLYKIRNLLVSGGNIRYFVLNPEDGVLIRYKTKEDFPFSPKETLNLTDIKQIKEIKPTWYMKKDMLYFEVIAILIFNFKIISRSFIIINK